MDDAILCPFDGISVISGKCLGDNIRKMFG